jgi:flagellar biosynthesis component FlhA
MKYFYLLIMACLLAVAGCKSSEQAKKSETKKETKKEIARQEIEKEKQEKDRLEQERIAKEQEEKQAKEELEKKKIESDKQKEELRKVQENLKRMGLAAYRVQITKDGNQIKYADGQTVTLSGTVVDRSLVNTLNDLLAKARDDERKKMNAEPACTGGYETCQDGWLYIYYMIESGNGNCDGQWYKIDQECK